VDQQTTGIITSSPGNNLFFFCGLQISEIANKFAEDPELTINANFEPKYFENLFSKFLVTLDIVICLLIRTFLAAIISELEKALVNKGYLYFFFKKNIFLSIILSYLVNLI
jgi:hypothetical protein